MFAHGEAHTPAAGFLARRPHDEAARIGAAVAGGEDALAFDEVGVFRQIAQTAAFPVLAVHDGPQAADFSQHRQAAGIIADQEDSGGAFAQMDDPANEAALIHRHGPRFDPLHLTGIGQQGLRERSVDLGGDAGGDAFFRRLAHQVEDALIGFQTVGHRDGGGFVAGQIAHFVFKLADAAFPVALAGDAGPEADFAGRAQPVADGGAGGDEKLGDLGR